MRNVFSLLILLAVICAALPASAGPDPVKRKVLVLYDSSDERTAQENLFVEGFAMPLNYLGLLYEIRDVAKRPLPGKGEMEQFGAVFTTFADDSMAGPNEYLKWLVRQQAEGRKVVIAGNLGAYSGEDGESADKELISKVYSNMGFSYKGEVAAEKIKLKFGYVDPENMNFERRLPLFPREDILLVPSSKKSRSWVTVDDANRPGEPGTVVGIGPGGGFALDGFMRWQDPGDFRKKWYMNPFEFLRLSLGLEGVPAFTPTTLNGLRVAFAHIDGDGFAGYTEVDENKCCVEIVMERIFSRYDFPNSASVIAGEIDPAVKGSLNNIELARTLFELKNVEPASHSYTHPFAWDPRLRDSKEYAAEFVVGQYEVSGYKFNARYEIVDSCRYISDNLAPPEKPCRVLLWSGMCDPLSNQAEIAAKAGILNLNGGDTVMDAHRDSYFGVSPLYRALGDYSQIYTGQANENILTDLWSGPYFGFRNIVETMKRTGSPRRVMPIDIYYHFYSGEKFASLKALEDVYEWALSQDSARVYASSYIRMVNGFLSGKMEKVAPDRFVFSDYRDCLSVRLDGKGRVPDLRNCSNILGYDVLPEGTFVHLRPGTKRAELVLSDNMRVNDGFLFIKSSSGWVRDFQRIPSGARFVLDCFSKGRVTLSGLVPGAKYRVIRKDGPPLELKSSEGGEVSVRDISSGPVEIVGL
ncbi:polysaccharide deacetylase [Maridesulfovibrio sp.]|uniref:polysaccharide deacetylase family protein n=1 Tax=Maridesulfovibrio sp. TaxID=2795000 RepID=UPI002A189944|nr:polysaccharide deacetylase [Maridesulfovibrio sp.]